MIKITDATLNFLMGAELTYDLETVIYSCDGIRKTKNQYIICDKHQKYVAALILNKQIRRAKIVISKFDKEQVLINVDSSFIDGSHSDYPITAVNFNSGEYSSFYFQVTVLEFAEGFDMGQYSLSVLRTKD